MNYYLFLISTILNIYYKFINYFIIYLFIFKL